MIENFTKNGWKTKLVKVLPGQEQAALAEVGGGAIWTDNLGRPIGIAFGGNLAGKRRQFAKYKCYAMLQVDTHTGESIIQVVNETHAAYTRRHQEKVS